MSEEFLHYIFQHKLWSDSKIELVNGEKFEILEIGHHNYNSGPDFINSKIKIQNTIWIGNIEIHVKSSDWILHKHHNDKAYNNTILHIVFTNDKQIYYTNGNPIPTWEIKFDQALFNNYSKLKNNYKEINCEDYIVLVEREKIQLYIEKLATERLEEKSNQIKTILIKTKNNWEETLYFILAKNFGFSINSIPFEILAERTALDIVRKYQTEQSALEALFFGQAGLLEEEIKDNYYIKLQKEYKFLKIKHDLQSIPPAIWKKSRMRPSNFPHIKIAQFSKIMSRFDDFFNQIIKFQNNKSINYFLNISVSEYWENHYDFNKSSNKLLSKLGQMTINSIIINTIAPFLYLYNQYYVLENNSNIYQEILSDLKGENNIETRKWEKLSIKGENAYETQALLHLIKNYCRKKECIKCKIGYEILNKINKIPISK